MSNKVSMVTPSSSTRVISIGPNYTLPIEEIPCIFTVIITFTADIFLLVFDPSSDSLPIVILDTVLSPFSMLFLFSILLFQHYY